MLAEFGCELDDNIEVRVWDSSAETRYLVLPQRPAHTDHLNIDELAAVVRETTTIGVAR